MALILRTALAPTRLERSAAVERLEPLELVLASYVLNGAQRLRINPLMVSPSNHWNEIRLKTGARQSGNHKGREGKKGIRKISHERLCLLSCLLIGDPAPLFQD